MGLWSCHREKAVKGAGIVTQAARELTPTRRRSVGRQGASSPRMVVMVCRRYWSCNWQQAAVGRKEEVENACMNKKIDTIYQPHNERWRIGRLWGRRCMGRTSTRERVLQPGPPPPPTNGRQVITLRLQSWRGIADESSSSCCKQANEKNGQTSRSVGTCLSRRTQKIRHATSSWAAAWRAVTADISDRDRGARGAGFGETWQNTRRSTARSSRLVVKNRNDVPGDLRHIP